MKNMITVSAIALSASLGATAAFADCGEVSITDMNWASSQVVTAVSKFIMEQGYGCAVTAVPSATVTAVASMAETNKPDIATEIWLNSAAAYPGLVEEGKVVTVANILSDGGEEGWYIPAYLAEAHPELASIDGILANPELVGARFHNCPVGWGCRVANDNMKVAFGLEAAGVEVFDHGSGETLATSIASAYADKKPWFGYYWAPTAILGKYPMVQVDLGPHNAEIHTCNQTPDCASPQKSSYPAATVLTAITTTFAEQEPEIVELMKNVSFTNAQMGEVLAWKEDTNSSSEEAAVYFLINYKDVWAGWLSDGAKGKLSAVLN